MRFFASKTNRQHFLPVLLTLAAISSHGFSPAVKIRPQITQRPWLTRRYVLNEKWQVLFNEPKNGGEKTAMRETSYTTKDFDKTNKAKKNPLSSLFSEDTSKHASMGELTNFLNPKDTKDAPSTESSEGNSLTPVLVALAVAALGVGAWESGVLPTSQISGFVENFVQDPGSALEQVTESVANMGPMGPVYFCIMYILAEVLAIPSIPLTTSAGYLFGVSTGTLVVLLSASVAATVSFTLGRTFLRETVEKFISEDPKLARLDKAIGREGFKLMLLLRLSPIFPFALSNYVYGATSIDFPSFFWGTLLGFAPGTLAYVYTGVVGKALTIGGDGTQPWYVYVGGAALLGGLLKSLVDVAGNIIEEMEEGADQQ